MKNEVDITKDENLIAYCGLYCGACPRFLKGKCNGCKENNPSWCKVKPCNLENNYTSCADCKQFDSVSDCKIFNPLLIRFGELVSRTSRKAGIQLIKDKGRTEFVNLMAENKLVSIKKGITKKST